MDPVRSLFCLSLFLFSSAIGRAGEFDLQLESGGVWFTRNDARIPGDSGTTFNMLDLTGDGPDAYVRLYATYAWNERHAVRVTLAPLETKGTGTLSSDTRFQDELFLADVPTKGTYVFNTYRLTYRWMFHIDERWQWGTGAALLVRDADIALEQGDLKENRDDLGVVPLLHLYGEYRWTEHLSLILDVEGAWSPVGRAFDATLNARYLFESGWYVAGGYRTLEGGADNDDVYTFAWLHYLTASAGYRF